MAVPEEVAKLIGKSLGESQVFEVDRGAIRRFADAIDDFNPLHRDVEYAKNSKYGEMITPVGFFGWPIKGLGIMAALGEAIAPIMGAGYFILLDGGIEYEPFIPIRAGDVLTFYARLADVPEKTTSSGKSMLLPVIEMNFLNQNGDKVLTVRWSLIMRQP
jgi:acyl dehydratase